MKDFTKRLTALVLVLAISASFTACNLSILNKGKIDDDDDGGGSWFKFGEDEPDESEPDETDPVTTPPPYTPGEYIETSDELTYPDKVPTYEELHPYKAPGNVTGQDAVDLLNEIELEVLQHCFKDYATVKIFFKDPEAYGITYDGITWGDATIDDDQVAEELAFDEELLAELYTIDYESLGTDDRLFYDKIVYDLELDTYLMSYSAFGYYTMIFNPLVGPQCDVLFNFELFDFETVEDAENYILLVEDIDRYYEQMIAYEEERAEYGFASSPTSYEAAAKSFDNLVKQEDDCFLYESFEERLDNIKDLSDDDRARLIQEHEDAMKNVFFPKMQECADRLRALKDYNGVDAGLCQYKGGDAYFAVLVMTKTNSSMPVDEQMAMLEAEVDKNTEEMLAIFGSGDLSWYYDVQDHDYTYGDVQDNLDGLYEYIDGKFPEIPAHEYYFMPVPEIFEDDFAPAAYMGYQLDTFDANQLIVNYGDLETDLGVTIAHESYPGHMYQSIYTRSASKHLYMYLGASIGYEEGWAVYCELYSISDIFATDPTSPAERIIWIDRSNNMFITAVLDFGIHYEGWTLDDCVDYFNEATGDLYGVTADSLQDYYTLLVTEPCYSIKYAMGYVHTKNIIENAKINYPDATELEIHTTYLNCLTTNYEEIQENFDLMMQGKMDPPQGS